MSTFPIALVPARCAAALLRCSYSSEEGRWLRTGARVTQLRPAGSQAVPVHASCDQHLPAFNSQSFVDVYMSLQSAPCQCHSQREKWHFHDFPQARCYVTDVQTSSSARRMLRLKLLLLCRREVLVLSPWLGVPALI